MKHVFRILLLAAVALTMFQSGWTCYSEDKECPSLKQVDMSSKDNFISAHGLTQETFSIWMREHSVWRDQNSESLKDFSYIPQDFDTDRGVK
ncbi:MAG TPA: hypothetical protein VGB23_06165 [Nitrospirota bacterium]|jgi:hypothetical protein